MIHWSEPRLHLISKPWFLIPGVPLFFNRALPPVTCVCVEQMKSALRDVETKWVTKGPKKERGGISERAKQRAREVKIYRALSFARACFLTLYGCTHTHNQQKSSRAHTQYALCACWYDTSVC